MSSTVTPYPYSSLLSEPESLRLLRLLRRDDTSAPIKCQLFNHSLSGSDPDLPQYVALSYVWGDPNKTVPIFVDDYRFEVTENLHAALCSLRERCVEWLWVDAICINQLDPKERGHQVRYMAKIYGKASRVLVWLGVAKENSGLVFDAIQKRKKWTNPSGDATIQQAIIALLQRPWFRRIWVLQEVAAARRIHIMCGESGIDGYAFCLGLKSLQIFYQDHPDLHSLIHSVTYLIRQANFRPTHIHWSDMSFLTIRPLGELLDMYHTHEATKRHDKVYALLGMSSDGLAAADLVLDYEVPWGEVFRRLLKFLLGEQVSVRTWDDEEVALIWAECRIVGRVSSVASSPGWGDTYKVDIAPRLIPEFSGNAADKTACWTLHNSAKVIQQNDFVCIIRGASNPTILRLCRGYFAVIVVQATPTKDEQTRHGCLRWSEVSQSAKAITRELPLIWDWAKFPEGRQARENIDALFNIDSRLEQSSEEKLNNHLKNCARLENMIMILEELGENEGIQMRLREMIEIHESSFGKNHARIRLSLYHKLALNLGKQGKWADVKKLCDDHPDTLVSMLNLALTYMNQGQWKKLEELVLETIEVSTRLLGDEHPSTLISKSYLGLAYRYQKRWQEAGELDIEVTNTFLRVLGAEHPCTLTSRGELASLYREIGEKEKAENLELQVMEAFKRVLGPEHPSTLTSMADLGSTYRSQGRFEEARKMEEQVMEMSIRVLGCDHQDTLTSMANLALTIHFQGNRSRAHSLMQNCARLRVKVLGLHHSHTVSTHKILERWEWEDISRKPRIALDWPDDWEEDTYPSP